jgi:hypothetical protein
MPYENMTISLTDPFTESRYFSRIAWPLGRCRPPTLSAMGQNRQKLGNNCLLTPSARSGRMGPH